MSIVTYSPSGSNTPTTRIVSSSTVGSFGAYVGDYVIFSGLSTSGSWPTTGFSNMSLETTGSGGYTYIGVGTAGVTLTQAIT